MARIVVIPVEYKRGKPKETDDADAFTGGGSGNVPGRNAVLRRFPAVTIYYGEIKHRVLVEFDPAFRTKRSGPVFHEMHKYFEQRYTPKVKTEQKAATPAR